jgi:TnsA endonuclease N terminal
MKAAVVNQEDFAEASYRNSDHEVVTTAWSDLDADAVAAGVPWRTFPWYLGQESYSGVYWCATVGSLVGYESRLELSHLMMADFDRSVKRIASQPFQLRHCTNGVIHRRVPDYLLCTENGPVVIDVVRSARLQDPGVRQKLEMTRRVIESRGWRYEIASDPPPVRYLNIPYGSCRVFVAVGRRLRVTQGRRVWLCIFCLVMARIDWPPGVPRRLDR